MGKHSTAMVHASAACRSAGKFLVGVAGVPGSGKSSLAREVVARLNKRGTLAVNVPMDGFHYFKHQLDTMPDPRVAHARRGAEWTFDASAFVTCLRQLKTGGRCSCHTLAQSRFALPRRLCGGCMCCTTHHAASEGHPSSCAGRGVAPSFDHGVGDPRPGMIEVDEQHQVLVAEGNYLLLAAEPWCHLQPLWDDTWYIDCEVDVAMQRVFERQTGNGVAAEVSRRRVATNDRPNAELVVTTKDRAAVLVPTLPLQYVKK